VAGNSASGVQAAGLANVAGGSVNGLQIAGLGNAAGGPFRGIQIAGLGNAAGGPFWGIQAGIYNRLYDGEGAALQVGLVNISENPRTLSLGLVNIVKNGLLHPAIYLDDLGFINAGFRSGSRQVYSLLSLGVLPPGDGEGFFVSRLGLGWEIALASFFIDLDAAAGSFIPLDGLGKFRDAKEEGRISLDLQVRLTAGYRIFKRLGLFAGISYSWLFPPGEGSPVPRSPLNPLPAGTGGGNRQRIGFFGGLEF
jgi:hypothetical protein